MRAVIIERAGMLTTVQDLGRWGHQRFGVPVSGPMDPWSHRRANRLVGNDDDAASLEVTLMGPTLRFEADAVFAVTGAEFELTVDDRPVPSHTSCRAGATSVLRFGRRLLGARAYVAIAGGVAVPAVLGSRSTHVASAMGGVDGRAIRPGDRIPIGLTREATRVGTAVPIPPLPNGGASVRVLRGPQDHCFGADALAVLTEARYLIGHDSDRMGYRLQGPPLQRCVDAGLLSDATPLGVIQVPASGQPILLMADRQTTGGYPKIATVISADIGVAGQLAPGDWIAFRLCPPGEAVRALLQQESALTPREGR